MSNEIEVDEVIDTEDSMYEEIDIDSLGKKLDVSAEDKGKPTFDSNTPATIMNVTLKKTKTQAVTRKGDAYYTPMIVTIETNTDDGQTSYDNYGGLRMTEEGNLWAGPKSMFGKLVRQIKEEDSSVETMGDVFKFLRTPGLRVKIKSTTTKYEDKEYTKNIITQFI